MKQSTKKILKKIICALPFGKDLFPFINIRRTVFRSASVAGFRPLDKFGRKKTIDKIYDSAFSKAFILISDPFLKGDIFEFGVAAGYSARFFAKYMKIFQLNDSCLHLFDSFIGLPEEKELDFNSYEFNQGVWEKGLMKGADGIEKYIQKKLSAILSPPRVNVIKGFFEDTVKDYFSSLPSVKAKLVHIDCDLYSSSKFVLNFLLKHEIIQDGTVIIFDDWMTSRGNPNFGQKKATSEVLSNYPHWELEKYFNYGVGSQVFICHDLRVTEGH